MSTQRKKSPPALHKAPPIVIAIVGRKGGVGKTTTATNLASELANRGYQTLLVDLDLQGDATTALTRVPFERTTGEVLQERAGLLDSLLQTDIPALWLLPTDDTLGERVDEMRRQEPDTFRFALRDVLAAEAGGFEYIVIDCPPSLNNVPLIGLCAATHYLAPLIPSYFALKSMGKLLEMTNWITNHPELNPDLKFLGVYFTSFNPKIKNALNKDILNATHESFPDQVLQHVRVDTNIGWAQRKGTPAQLRTPDTNAVADFSQLTDQVLARL